MNHRAISPVANTICRLRVLARGPTSLLLICGKCFEVVKVDLVQCLFTTANESASDAPQNSRLRVWGTKTTYFVAFKKIFGTILSPAASLPRAWKASSHRDVQRHPSTEISSRYLQMRHFNTSYICNRPSFPELVGDRFLALL